MSGVVDSFAGDPNESKVCGVNSTYEAIAYATLVVLVGTLGPEGEGSSNKSEQE